MASNLSADIVVIGSGIVGSLLAERLARAGASVLILESGPRIDRGTITAHYRNSPRKGDYMSPYPLSDWAPDPRTAPKDNGYLVQTGPHPYLAQYIRAVGGTTWHWAAQAWRVLPNDMRIQSLYGVGRDWALSYDELEPYYFEAEVKTGVSGGDNSGSPRSKPFPMQPVVESWATRRFRERLAPAGFELINDTTARNSRNYDGRPACCGNNNCMPICPIDAQYHGGLAADAAERAGARIEINAVVYKLEHDERGRITAVHYYDPQKVSHRVTGKVFVLAANAIESPKILLMSASDKFKNGLANSSDMVGRNLMDHPATSLTFDTEEPLWPGRGPMSPASLSTFRDGDFRREHAAFRVNISNASAVSSVAASLIKQGVYGEEFERQLLHRAARQVRLKNVLEQLPDPKNRVTLSSRRDALGLPTPQVYYDIDDYVHRGAEVSKSEYRKIADLMGGTNFQFSADRKYGASQHICGTMMMGSDPRDSVVDGTGRTHDHENLYVASTGIMPSMATVNSTLTAVALALRSAHHIQQEL